MTKLTLLHLSDIHIKSVDTLDDKTVEAIVRALRPHVRNPEQPVGIVLSGDIAFSGLKEQYEIVQEFLEQLIDQIKREGAGSVFVITAPGNHDCCYAKDDDTRDFIIDGINGRSAASAKSIGEVTACQANYFDFADRYQDGRDHRLWWRTTVDALPASVTILSLNSAWLSRLDEKEGGKYFPVEQLRAAIPLGSGLTLAVMHHPPNWFGQQSYHELRSFFR